MCGGGGYGVGLSGGDGGGYGMDLSGGGDSVASCVVGGSSGITTL